MPTYSTDLTPEPQLRQLVLIAGLATAGLGGGMILATPLPLLWRLLAAALWLGSSVHELVVLRRGQRGVERLRVLQGGSARLCAPDGCWFPATLAPGSVVLRRVAWLRFVADDGRKFAELLHRKSVQNESWRRLQVIWRHLGAGT